MDKRKNNGGHSPKGAGRPKKVDEEKVNALFLVALKRIHNKNEDDEAKVSFIEDLLTFYRGKMFVAEHIFGKPEVKIDATSNGETIQSPIIAFGTDAE